MAGAPRAGPGPASLRLLLVTPDDRPAAALLALLAASFRGGVTAVLLRERRLPPDARAALYGEACALARALGVLALVSRDVAAARAAGADGVHCGHGGPSVAQVREAAPSLWVGRSAHWPLQPDDEAADLLTLSPFRATPRSFPRPPLAPAQVEDVLRHAAGRPVVALGGLTADDVPALPRGLAGVAVLRAIAAAPDPASAAARLRAAADARFGPADGA